MQQPPTALILAGGFATRLWPLTEKRAKPLLQLAGKPLIAHILGKIPAEIPIIISTNAAFSEDFEAFLVEHFPDRQIELYIEDSQDDAGKKGALAATAQVIRHFQPDSPLLLVAGDNYFGFDVQHFLDFYAGKTVLASYDTKSLKAAKQFGVLSVDGRRLTDFVEKPEDPPSTLISTGCYLFQPEHFSAIEDYSQQAADNLGGIFEYLLSQDQEVEVYQFDEPWIDIGSFESYLAAHHQLIGENLIHTDSHISHCEIGESVDIGPNCVLENVQLDRVIIMEGCTIRNARLRDCVIDKNCHLENIDLDGKMIRAGSKLSGFVEE